MMPAIVNHLWQSTIFAGVAALLTLAFRSNRAQMRYRIWLAASLKFLVPFSLLVSVGSRIEWRTAAAATPQLRAAMEQMSQPFSPVEISNSAAPASSTILPAVLLAIWLIGCAGIVAQWWVRSHRLRAAIRTSTPLPIEAPVAVLSTSTPLEPGVFGVFRPVLLLPDGIAERLSPDQLNAILAHELCHVRRRDNLAAAFHMLVEAIFWFHPLVWWIGSRLVEERERACDEEVLRLGNRPQVYAEGILNVCKFYIESPLACASGVTGSDLKKRIEAIMTDRISHNLTLARKVLLATAGIAAIAGPILLGVLHAPQGRAQTKAEDTKFEVASIKPADPNANGMRLMLTPGGGLNVSNFPVKQLIQFAYDVHPFQVTGGPSWIEQDRYEIQAKSAASDEPAVEMRAMSDAQRKAYQVLMRQRVQALLAERFQLKLHKESKESSVYALTVAKNGPKLKESTGGRPDMMRAGRGELTAEGIGMEQLTKMLGARVGRPVIDHTGLKGQYDFKLQWADAGGPGMGGPVGPGGKPEMAATTDLSGPTIFTALQEQLGLKLESQKAPVDVFVIDRIEKPSDN